MMLQHKIEIYIAKQYGIRVESARAMIQANLIRESEVKKILLRREYEQRKGGDKKGRIRDDLANEFCVSVSLVEKAVLRKKNA